MSTYLNLKPVEFDKLSAKRQAEVQWAGRLVLPKYDGCFAIMLWRGGELIRVLSRDGKSVVSMDHLQEDMLYTYPWLRTAGQVAVLGEAWMKGKEFKEISGTFRRRSVQHALQFAPFDIVGWEGEVMEPVLSSPAPYENRLAALVDSERTTCMIHKPWPLRLGEYEETAKAGALAKANEWKASPDGYDGAIVSDPAAPYVVSDGKGEFLKVKPLQTFTLEVVDVAVGVGERTGRPTVSLVVRFKSGRCGVGTGFSNGDAAAWAADPGSVIGNLVEVGCMGVYDGPNGMMREPRVLGWRDDVTTPDY